MEIIKIIVKINLKKWKETISTMTEVEKSLTSKYIDDSDFKHAILKLYRRNLVDCKSLQAHCNTLKTIPLNHLKY